MDHCLKNKIIIISFCIVYKPRLNWSVRSFARLNILSWTYLLTISRYIFVLGSLYFVEDTLNPNSMIEI